VIREHFYISGSFLNLVNAVNICLGFEINALMDLCSVIMDLNCVVIMGKHHV